MPATKQLMSRRQTPGHCTLLIGKCLLRSVVLILVSATCSYSFAASFIDHDQLKEQITHYVKGQLPHSPDTRYEINVMGLDPRSRLKACSEELQLSPFRQGQIRSHMTIKVSCEGKKAWQIYIPVQINKEQRAVVAKHTINSGEKLTEHDLGIEFIASNRIRNQFYSQLDDLLGAQVKRGLRAGQVVTNRQICLVCDGEPVTIIARGEGFSLKTAGLALDDGISGQVISIKNSRSGRTLRGKVIDVGKVQVSF